MDRERPYTEQEPHRPDLQMKLKVTPAMRDGVRRTAAERGWTLQDVLRDAIAAYCGIENFWSPRHGGRPRPGPRKWSGTT